MMKVGYIFGLLGAIIMLGSEFGFALILLLLMGLLTMGGSVEGIGAYGLELVPLTIGISFALGIVAMIFVIKSKKGNKKAFLIVLIIGIIAAVGVFIPIAPARVIDLGGGDTYPAPAVTLINSILFIEPYFLINCGLIGLLSYIDTGFEDVEEEDYSLKIT